MEELFEYALLLRSGNTDEPSIGFYFQQLRDYIIAFKTQKFNKMEKNVFELEFKNVVFPSMRADVFTLYYRLASKEHKLIFDAEVRKNAEDYLNCYKTLIKNHFPALTKRFSPGTDGRIGFIGEFNLSRQQVEIYGFRSIEENDEDVYFIPIQNFSDRTNLTHLSGGINLHGTNSSNCFRDGIDITYEVIENELFQQIRVFVTQGLLNEESNPEMLTEHILGLIYQHKNTFRSLFTHDQKNICFPIELDAILDCVLREKLAQHFRDEIIDKKRRNGMIQETWNESIVSYSFSPTLDDLNEIEENVDRVLLNRDIPVFRGQYLEKLETELTIAINALRQSNILIEKPVLFKSFPSIELRVIKGNKEQLDLYKTYICNFYTAFLSNYKMLIETNFPTLRSHFSLYNTFPVSVFIKIEKPNIYDEYSGAIPLTIFFAKTASLENTVEIVDNILFERKDNVRQLIIDGSTYEEKRWIKTSVENLFHSQPSLDYGAFPDMHLRALVYSEISSELREFEKAVSHEFFNNGVQENKNG